jgi:N-methylhydantoinase B
MTARPLDPISLEVLWNRLVSVCNEQAAALIRTSFSTVVRESEDLSAGVFDANGDMIAQSVTGTPGHINSMATAMRHFLAVYGADDLDPGDVLVTNDPWFTSGQLHDLTVVTPIFRAGTVVAFFANTCHAADIGGRGLSADAREVYEEGLYLPILKLYRGGEPNDDVLRIIAGNVRAPAVVLGDLHAQVACNDVGGGRLLEFMDEFRLETIEPLADEIVSRSERAMREAIDAVPDGVYENETTSDGFADEGPVRLRCTVTVDGDALRVDYSGSSGESRYGINVVLNYTAAYTTFCVKAAISPEVPNNEGSFRPVDVVAPEGCILNARRPAAVAGRHIIGHLIPDAVFGALAPVLPDRVLAEGAAAIWITQARGRRPDGEPFTFAVFSCGGTGARSVKDGLGNTGFPSGVAGVPAEVVEAASPLLVHARELRCDSGGPGRFRGGVGQSLRLGVRSGHDWTVSVLCDRLRSAPRGYRGASAGAAGSFSLSDGSQPDPKAQQELSPATEVLLELPGGGGFWPPWERDAEAVLADVVEGRVSVAAAEAHYGVVIRRDDAPHDVLLAADFAVDEEATARARSLTARRPAR